MTHENRVDITTIEGTIVQIKIYLSMLIITASLIARVAHAKEITLPYKGITLNANLELAAGKTTTDGIILITHGGLGHWGMETIVYLQELFKEHGDSTLAINLSLGLNNRHGMYDCKVTQRHRNDDAADEIGAWVTWLKSQGVSRVVLLGHSRGGAQTALYAADHHDAWVKAVVLMAPATRANSDAADYQQRYHSPLAPVLAKAETLIKNGKGNNVMQHVGLLNCADTSATADAFLSYYGPKARVDAPELIKKIQPPTLVVVAGKDEIVVGLDKKITPLMDGQHRQIKIVEGAGHAFRDLYSDDAVEAIDTFLKGTGH